MAPATALDFPANPIAEPKIEIYGPADCPNCSRAQGIFTRADIAHTKTVIVDGDPNYEYVTKTLGYSTAPVIVVTFDGKRTIHWGGHRPDMLAGLTTTVRKFRANAAASIITDPDELATAGA